MKRGLTGLPAPAAQRAPHSRVSSLSIKLAQGGTSAFPFHVHVPKRLAAGAATVILLLLCGLYAAQTAYSAYSTDRADEHPISTLIRQAQARHNASVAARPTSLSEAYTSYVAKYDRRPPKGFDKWYTLSVRNGAANLHSFDEMQSSLAVWWGVTAEELRARTAEMLRSSGPNSLMHRVQVHDGRVVRWTDEEAEAMRGKDSPFRLAVHEMLIEIEEQVGPLPSFTMWINNLDEPRVALAHETREDLEERGCKGRLRKPKSETLAFEPSTRSPYDVARQVCPPSSLARQAALSRHPGSEPRAEEAHAVAFSDRHGFVADHSKEAATWCDQPDLQDLHSVFIKPLSFSYTNQLFPVFSNSKISGFADILVPSWWHWFNNTRYAPEEDTAWHAKKDTLFWRGRNTGGFSQGSNWLGWQRSRLVSRLNRPAEWGHSDHVLVHFPATNTLEKLVLPTHYLNDALADVAFVEPDLHGDAESLRLQRGEPSFRFTDSVPFRANYAHKAIFDVDGTAFSGRCIALLHSRSAVFKSRLYREAMDQTLIEWYHYVPVSLRLTEIYSVMGYFLGATRAVRSALLAKVPLDHASMLQANRARPHEQQLKDIADQGSEWARRSANRADLSSYMHLLALEWGRLWADDRAAHEFVL